MKRKQLVNAISAILAASALCAAAPVLSQDQTDAAPVLSQDQTDQDPGDKSSVEEVIITGSRIRKDAFTSSTPISVVDVGEASIQGIANVGELLQTNTVAMGSPQVNAATSFEFVQNGGLGTSTISLRGLGANRTLVLLNGRRAGPSGTKGGTSSFDLSVLPLATIERIEILKDGASSIYGSDAVAGVVNIITKKADGGTVDAFVSLPSESGGEKKRVSASWGKSFSRGSFRVTADYQKEEQLRRGQRNYFNCGNQYVFDQNTGERADIVDPRTGKYHCDDLTWGHVWLYDYSDPSNIPAAGSHLAQFDYAGDNLGQFIPGFAAPATPDQLTSPPGFFPVGYDRLSDSIQNDDHPFQDQQSLIPSTELTTLYLEGDFQVTDHIKAYSEVLINRRTTKSDSYRQEWSYIYSGNFDFANGLAPGAGNSLSAAAGWFGAQWLSPTGINDHNDAKVQVDYQRYVLGLQGDVEGVHNWNWDLSVQYSHSSGDYTNDRIYNDSIRDQNWLSGSCVGTVTSVRGVPCVDIPWLDPQFLRGDISPEVSAFLFGTETGNTEYNQWAVDGSVSGDLFSLPAGTVGLAVGFSYRYDELTDTPGLITFNPTIDPVTGKKARDPVTGDILGVSNSWLDDAAGITSGNDTTRAVFAEVNVPLLADLPLIRSLTFNGSARFTDVDSSGSKTTWKLGLNWQITNSLRIRGNRGTSFRAPALFELFLANQTSSISQRSDPCIQYEANFQSGDISQNVHDNCAADPRNLPPDYTGGTITPTVFTGGGAGVLKSETSDSHTLGVIWQPSFADLSLSVDYFDISIKNEVDQLGGANIIAGCYESDFGFAHGNTEPLCNLFDRTSINFGIDNVKDSFINIASQVNKGYDFAARYSTRHNWGVLTVNLEANHQTKDVKAKFVETPEDFNGRIGDPDWVGTSRITLDHGSFEYFWGLNWVGSSSSVSQFGRGNVVTYRGQDFTAVRSTKDIYYHSFSVKYSMTNGLDILLGVANAFDQHPPKLTGVAIGNEYARAGNSVVASQYDFNGQRFFLNLSKTF